MFLWLLNLHQNVAGVSFIVNAVRWLTAERHLCLTTLSALSSDSIKDSNGRVLVHCQAGISRSATICLAYLMKKKRVRLEEAFDFVKQRRSIISPNFSFMGQLLQFESQVLATSCSVEAASPSATLGPKSSSTPTSPFIFSFPMSVVTHSQPSSLAYLQSPITTSPSCWYNTRLLKKLQKGEFLRRSSLGTIVWLFQLSCGFLI